MTTELVVPRLMIRDTSDQSVHRVIHVEATLGLVWVFGIGERGNWPKALKLQEISEAISHEQGRGSYEVADDESLSNFKNCPDLSKHYERAKQNWALIKPLVSDEVLSDLLRPRHRRSLIAERAMEAESNVSTIERMLRRYWRGGMTLSALLPEYEGRCGSPGRPRNSPGRRKPGPKKKYELDQGVAVTSELDKFMTRACTRYLGNKMTSLKAAWDWLVGTYFMRDIYDDSGCVVGREQSDAPSLGQLRHFLNTRFSQHERLFRRAGRKTYDLKHRPLLSSADWDSETPGKRFLIDATIADIYLVSELCRTLVVGRPTVYLVMDAFSRMIVGFYVGYEHPSSAAAALAIINVVTSKKQFCAFYGIDIDDDEWPCQHLGEKILGDCGEMKSVRQWKGLVEQLHVEVENAGTGRGDLKAIVERAFGTVQFEFKPFTPGVVEKDAGERGVRDYRKDAMLTLREFTAELILCILTHNSQVAADRIPPAQMVAAGIPITPLNLWRWGSQNRPGSLRASSADKVALCTLPRETGAITRRGLEFKGRFYHFPHAIEHEWFSGSNKDQGKIDVAYDPRNVDNVYVIDARLPNGYQIASEIERVESRAGVSLVEMNQISTLNRVNNAKEEKRAQIRRIDKMNRLEEINSNATDATKAALEAASMKAPDISKMRETRGAERRGHGLAKATQAFSETSERKPSELQLALKKMFAGNQEPGGDV